MPNVDLHRLAGLVVSWGPDNIPPRWQQALRELSEIVATFHCSAIEEPAVSKEHATRTWRLKLSP